MVFLYRVQNLHIHAEKTHEDFGAHCTLAFVAAKLVVHFFHATRNLNGAIFVLIEDGPCPRINHVGRLGQLFDAIVCFLVSDLMLIHLLLLQALVAL